MKIFSIFKVEFGNTTINILISGGGRSSGVPPISGGNSGGDLVSIPESMLMILDSEERPLEYVQASKKVSPIMI